MTVKITAVVAGKKVTVVIDAESKDLADSLRDNAFRTLCNQIPWLTELTVKES